ncbi:MarR family winged helix-turn-helix transcriptional regulator [Syntrophomonas zehnderi]|nr:MarR family transcriptional regulator [Syntrophomonas zehnderi]
MKKVEKRFGQVLEEFGVTMAQSFILFALLEQDGCALTEIGNRTQIDNSSLTTMVDKLEKEALVERRPYALDRRVVALHLTDKGRDLALKVFNAGAAINQELSNKLADDKEPFINALTNISETLERKNLANK